MPELRKDPVTGNWIVVDQKIQSNAPLDKCPFCPGNEHLTPPTIREYRDHGSSWIIRCFSAINPVFVIEAKENKRGEGIYDKMDNVGAHEVIVENRSHTKTMSDYTEREMLFLFEMYQERIRDLKKDRRFRYIQVFKNHGELTGSQIIHPHSHVLATPIMPQRLDLELSNSKAHYIHKERCLFCDIISQEIRQNKRVIAMNADFISLCPFASRFPFETWILPIRHGESFENMRNEAALRELVSIFLDTMKRIERVSNAYTMVIHSSPNIDYIKSREDEDIAISEHFHWHIEILPRDLKTSKYKREDEFYVIDMNPEDAASKLSEQPV